MSFSLWTMDCRGHPRELDRVVTACCRACSGRSWPKTGRFPRSGAGIHPQILLTRREECLWLSHQGAVQDGYLLPPGWIRPLSHPMKNHQIMPVQAPRKASRRRSGTNSSGISTGWPRSMWREESQLFRSTPRRKNTSEPLRMRVGSGVQRGDPSRSMCTIFRVSEWARPRCMALSMSEPTKEWSTWACRMTPLNTQWKASGSGGGVWGDGSILTRGGC